MKLMLNVLLEKFSNRQRRVLRHNIMLMIVGCEPIVERKILFKRFIIDILQVDSGVIIDITWLRKFLIHVGHIVVLLVVNHVLYLLIRNE